MTGRCFEYTYDRASQTTVCEIKYDIQVSVNQDYILFAGTMKFLHFRQFSVMDRFHFYCIMKSKTAHFLPPTFFFFFY